MVFLPISLYLFILTLSENIAASWFGSVYIRTLNLQHDLNAFHLKKKYRYACCCINPLLIVALS